MTSVLRLDDVSLHRGTTRILTHVTWSVDEGQYWVLLGPNGAGKTTIARIAAARLFPSAGTVEVLGERLGRVDISELHPRIGLCSSALARTVMGGESVLSVVLSASYGKVGVWREEYEDLDVERARALLDALGAAPLARLAPWDDIVCCSAETHENVDEFTECVVAFLPAGPKWFPEDMETDQPLEVIVAEFIREKILRSFRDEVPHAIGVKVEEMKYARKKNLDSIRAIIYVEHDSQKGIIIGRGGEAIKRVGSEARTDLEQLLGTRVYLDLNVKVKKNWRRDATQIKRFGYGEGA